MNLDKEREDFITYIICPSRMGRRVDRAKVERALNPTYHPIDQLEQVIYNSYLSWLGRAQNAPEQRESWEVIFENIKVDIPNKEWTAKFYAGIEIEARYHISSTEFGSWEDVRADFLPHEFAVGHEFREKPRTKKYQAWCVDFITSYGELSVYAHESIEGAENFITRTSCKVLSKPYLKEYEV